MEDWQSLGIALSLLPLLRKVVDESERRRIPPIAFLITAGRSEGVIAFNHTIRVRCTLESGVSEEIGLKELWERYGEVWDIAPLTPFPAMIIYVKRRLLAWDIRSVLPLFSDVR